MKAKGMYGKILDVSWGSFINQLEYKAKWAGRTLIKVPKYYPSSQLCSHCGNKNTLIKNLDVITWTCPTCGTLHDRDINASVNILKEGKRILGIE